MTDTCVGGARRRRLCSSLLITDLSLWNGSQSHHLSMLHGEGLEVCRDQEAAESPLERWRCRAVTWSIHSPLEALAPDWKSHSGWLHASLDSPDGELKCAGGQGLSDLLAKLRGTQWKNGWSWYCVPGREDPNLRGHWDREVRREDSGSEGGRSRGGASGDVGGGRALWGWGDGERTRSGTGSDLRWCEEPGMWGVCGCRKFQCSSQRLGFSVILSHVFMVRTLKGLLERSSPPLTRLPTYPFGDTGKALLRCHCCISWLGPCGPDVATVIVAIWSYPSRFLFHSLEDKCILILCLFFNLNFNILRLLHLSLQCFCWPRDRDSSGVRETLKNPGENTSQGQVEFCVLSVGHAHLPGRCVWESVSNKFQELWNGFIFTKESWWSGQNTRKWHSSTSKDFLNV